MDDRGWLSPSARGALHLTLQVLLSVGLFAVLQFLAFRHNARFDLTPLESFVLSPHAKQVAEAFDQPALITVFYSSQDAAQRREMFDLLEQFRSASPQIQFRLHDLDRSPGLANRYGISSYNSGVVEVGHQPPARMAARARRRFNRSAWLWIAYRRPQSSGLPASETAYSGPRNFKASQRKM